MDGTAGQVDNLDHLYHAIQLFLDLLKGHIVGSNTDGHAGYILLLCGSYGKTLQIIGLTGKESGDLSQNTDFILDVEGDPAIFHFRIRRHALPLI